MKVPPHPPSADEYHARRRARLEALEQRELVDLLEDAAKNWLAHDGLWFLAAEHAHGMACAIDLDRRAWEKFTVLEARRIMKRHGMAEASGLAGLEQALEWRLYSHLNEQRIVERTATSFVLQVEQCRVQAARRRDGRPDFPCKPVGLVEYAEFARTIDSRIETHCVCCPPDACPDGTCCAWRFQIR